jgi:SHS2 domain-containing protein
VKDPGRKTPFRELEHTADLRVEIVGRNEKDLFANAIESLYALLGLPIVSKGREQGVVEELEISGSDPEEALVGLLGEILYRATVERKRINLHELSAPLSGKGASGCRIVVRGVWQALTEEEMADLREIKAVTYHDVRIRRTRGGLAARVVMDL